MRLPVDLGRKRFDADILSGLLSDKNVEILEFQRDILSQDHQDKLLDNPESIESRVRHVDHTRLRFKRGT